MDSLQELINCTIGALVLHRFYFLSLSFATTRARPSYITAAITFLRNAMRSKPPFNVVEIGSGTGIFTQALLAHPDWSSDIRELKAVEPSQGMRNAFSENVTDKRVTIREGTFESTGVANGWADIIVAAQVRAVMFQR